MKKYPTTSHMLAMPLGGPAGIRPGHVHPIIEASALPGFSAVQVRVPWNYAQTARNEFDFYYLREILRNSELPVVVMLCDKTFRTDQRFTPAWIRTITYDHGTVAVRWDENVIRALADLHKAVHQEFADHPRFFGTATQETAIGMPDEQKAQEGYDPITYAALWQWLHCDIAAKSYRSRLFSYFNYIPNGNQYLLSMVRSMAAAGVVVGGPDIRRTDQALNSFTYPVYAGLPETASTFCSAQYKSLEELTVAEIMATAHALGVGMIPWNYLTWGDVQTARDVAPVINGWALDPWQYTHADAIDALRAAAAGYESWRI